ncbi:MAG: hypothetical protein ACYCO9_16405 [Streptosporangiaceae bacterium]
MSVRGTTHARLVRKVIVRDGDHEGEKIVCAWLDCDKDGYMLYHVATNEAKPGFPRRLARYVFCSERHKQYWLNSHRPGMGAGMAPGYRNAL